MLYTVFGAAFVFGKGQRKLTLHVRPSDRSSLHWMSFCISVWLMVWLIYVCGIRPFYMIFSLRLGYCLCLRILDVKAINYSPREDIVEDMQAFNALLLFLFFR